MEKFKNHLFGDCIFSRVARPTGSNTVGRSVPDSVVNSIDSVIQNMAMPVFWCLHKLWLYAAVKAILLCDFYKFIKRKREANFPIVRISDVIFKQSFFCVVTKSMPCVSISRIGNFPIFFSNATTRSCLPSLNAADPCFKILAAITLALRKIVVRILGVTSRYTDYGEMPNAHSGVFGFCAFSYHFSPQRFILTFNYTLSWDKFKGQPLRGLTLRRQREYAECVG